MARKPAKEATSRSAAVVRMSTLRARVDGVTKARVQAAAEAQQMNESEFLRAVLELMFSDPPELHSLAANPNRADTVRLQLRLPRFLGEGVQRRAKLKGVVASRWVSALIQSNLMADPVLCGDEVTALMGANRELAAIGRNLNQIARTLNEAFYRTDAVRVEVLETLLATVQAHRQEVMKLVQTSKQYWAATDEQL